MKRLDPADYRDLVRRALEEDIGSGDVTTLATVEPTERARGVFVVKARLRARRPGCRGSKPSVRSTRRLPVARRRLDGERCTPGDEIGDRDRPRPCACSSRERTALNFLQRLSGIATRTRQFVDAAGGRITVLDTRKTTPTLRMLEKYAVARAAAPTIAPASTTRS